MRAQGRRWARGWGEVLFQPRFPLSLLLLVGDERAWPTDPHDLLVVIDHAAQGGHEASVKSRRASLRPLCVKSHGAVGTQSGPLFSKSGPNLVEVGRRAMLWLNRAKGGRIGQVEDDALAKRGPTRLTTCTTALRVMRVGEGGTVEPLGRWLTG